MVLHGYERELRGRWVNLPLLSAGNIHAACDNYCRSRIAAHSGIPNGAFERHRSPSRYLELEVK